MPAIDYDHDGVTYHAWNNVPTKDIACYEWAQKQEPPFPLPKKVELSANMLEGKLTTHEWKSEIVYLGVSGTYELYVPQHYHGQEAALMVFMDGSSQYIQAAKVPSILDTMILNEEIPVVIDLFINWGNPGPGLPRYGGTDHRSIEYNSIDDRYVTFLDKEILSKLRKEYNITSDPEKCVICGISSSGNAAFAAAWHRPDLFRKVISHCGSFTAIRGGEQFPYLIRQYPKKPIKVFL